MIGRSQAPARPYSAQAAGADRSAVSRQGRTGSGQDRRMVCVKPQIWREAAGMYASWLAEDAVIVSVVAGVGSRDLAQEFGGRVVARVIPTTASAINRGTASLYADDPAAMSEAHALFELPGPGAADISRRAPQTCVRRPRDLRLGPGLSLRLHRGLEAAPAAAGLAPSDAEPLWQRGRRSPARPRRPVAPKAARSRRSCACTPGTTSPNGTSRRPKRAFLGEARGPAAPDARGGGQCAAALEGTGRLGPWRRGARRARSSTWSRC